MTGLTGGTVASDTLRRMASSLDHEPWYESERFEDGSYGLAGQHHGSRDPTGHTFWTDGRRAGAIDGAITNRHELGWSDAEVFERLLRAPERTLRTLEGPFVVACLDAADDRLLLSMDKIGCRPCFYATADDAATNGIVFGSELKPIMAAIDDPTVDEQGISDLVLMGTLWSDTTLLEGVRALHPATVLEYRDGEVTTSRYWKPDYDRAEATEQYFFELVDQFRHMMDRVGRSMTGDVGLWLSGGLDSRATMNELARCHRTTDSFDSLVAFTYDANPSGGGNPELAQQVADTLETPIEHVPLTPDRFLDVMEKGVDVLDGQVRWSTFLNLSAVFNIEQYDADVIMEGLEGALVGHHLCRHHFTDADSLVDSMYRSEASLSTDDVGELLNVDADPLGSFRKEARRIDEDSFAGGVVDAHFQNYYSRVAHASNHLSRSQVGTRVTYADGDFLSHVARLPLSYRMGALPFSDGELIHGVVKPKLRMIRALNDDLANIRYERSSLKPKHPFPAHVAGFYGSTALAQLRSQTTYGGTSMPGKWYREHDGLQAAVDELIDDACDRSLFDADALRERQRRHLQGEADEINAISSITTAELWLQRHLD